MYIYIFWLPLFLCVLLLFCEIFSAIYVHTHTHTHIIFFFFKQRIAVQTSPDWFAFLFMFLIFGSCYLAFLKLAQLHFKVFALLLELISCASSKERIYLVCSLGGKISDPSGPSFLFCLSSLFDILSNTESGQSAWLRGTRALLPRLPVWFVTQRSVMLAKWFNPASLVYTVGLGLRNSVGS